MTRWQRLEGERSWIRHAAEDAKSGDKKKRGGGGGAGCFPHR